MVMTLFNLTLFLLLLSSYLIYRVHIGDCVNKSMHKRKFNCVTANSLISKIIIYIYVYLIKGSCLLLCSIAVLLLDLIIIYLLILNSRILCDFVIIIHG